MATVLITGGTGLIGTALTNALASNGDNVIILTRPGSKNLAPGKKISYANWDPKRDQVDLHAISNADYLVHLAGANVAEGRWTSKRKKELVDSRVQSGRLLVKILDATPNNIKAVISASAIGYYGPDPVIPNPVPFGEESSPAHDFLGNLAQEWESAIQPVTKAGKRLVVLRTGIVLSREGGAYPEFKKTLSFRIASILGSGRQVVSWIHIDDLVRMYMDAIENDGWQGIYNAVAPNPVANKKLALQIAKQKSKPFIPVHVPNFILKTVLGEMSVEVLKSTTVSASKIMKQGFQFKFPSIEEAVRELES